MPARKQPEPDEAEPVFVAIRRWRLADEAYKAARVELDTARVELVAALKAVGVEGFSL